MASTDPPSARAHGVTQLLQAWSAGDRDALDRAIPIVYKELYRLAKASLRRERPGHTLQATALVNEAYLRLVDQRRVHWQNRAHFLGTAAQLMRRILVDHVRKGRAAKRGAGGTRVLLSDTLVVTTPRDVDLMALDAALERLAALDSRQSEIVVLRFFGGLSIEETATVLEVSPATVKREWSTARVWLRDELDRKGRTDA